MSTGSRLKEIANDIDSVADHLNTSLLNDHIREIEAIADELIKKEEA